MRLTPALLMTPALLVAASLALLTCGCKGPRPAGPGVKAERPQGPAPTPSAEPTPGAARHGAAGPTAAGSTAAGPNAAGPTAAGPNAAGPGADKKPGPRAAGPQGGQPAERGPQGAAAAQPNPQPEKAAPPPPAPSPPAPTQKGATGPVELVDATPEIPADIVVHNAVGKAAEDHKDLLVYVGATWCAPCERFKEAAKKGELDAALPGVRFLMFDADADAKRLRAAGYRWTYVPLFVRPAVNGHSSGQQIAGVPNKAAGVANLAPRIKALLGR